MPRVTLSSKNQITLPADIVRKLGLRPGDKIVAELMDDHVVLLPQPESWADYFAGSLKGVYGSTKEEIDRYIAEERHGWDIDGLKDAIAGDEKLRAVYNAIPSSDVGVRRSKIGDETGINSKWGYLDKYLERLIELNAIKQIPLEFDPEKKQGDQMYRRIP